MKKIILFVVVLITLGQLYSQNIYKTPSGKKYHLAKCRMVENVSKKLVGTEDVNQYNLEPCKICNPPLAVQLFNSNNSANKAVGESVSVRCKGYTKERERCKHTTRLANGYCYQHTSQNSTSNSYNSENRTLITSVPCGARTKSGGYCRRLVRGGGRCYQHD